MCVYGKMLCGSLKKLADNVSGAPALCKLYIIIGVLMIALNNNKK